MFKQETDLPIFGEDRHQISQLTVAVEANPAGKTYIHCRADLPVTVSVCVFMTLKQHRTGVLLSVDL